MPHPWGLAAALSSSRGSRFSFTPWSPLWAALWRGSTGWQGSDHVLPHVCTPKFCVSPHWSLRGGAQSSPRGGAGRAEQVPSPRGRSHLSWLSFPVGFHVFLFHQIPQTQPYHSTEDSWYSNIWALNETNTLKQESVLSDFSSVLTERLGCQMGAQ